MGTTNSVGSLVFTGISQYSSDFQSILQHAQAVNQIPIQALQTQQSANLSKKQALIALNPMVANLGSAVAALGTIASGGGLTASSSDSTAVSILNNGATGPSSHTISNITLATAASETSRNKYADATTAPVWVAGQNKFDLVVGSKNYSLDLTGNNNLTGLVNAINTSGAPVTASIINTGSGDYLSIAANSVGAATLTLSGVPQPASLITNSGTGTETSLAGYPDTGTAAVSNSGTVDLTVGGGAPVQLDISANNNLTGLMNAINSAGAGVTASISSSGGKNYLQLVSSLGPAAITLNDTAGSGNVNLITSSNQGTSASFTLDGNINVTNQATNVFNNVLPGLSFTLNRNYAGSVNLAVVADSNQLTNALQTFTQDYNAMVDQVAQQTGSGAGALSGDVLIRDISDDLRQLSSYSRNSSSTVNSLYDLGITFADTTGHLSFDPTVVSNFSSSRMADAFKFLGSSTSGLGLYANNFTQLSDPVEGLVQIQETGYDTANSQLTDQINALNTRANQLQASLNAKLQAADALAAQLQSRQNTLTAEVQSIDYVSYGRLINSNTGA